MNVDTITSLLKLLQNQKTSTDASTCANQNDCADLRQSNSPKTRFNDFGGRLNVKSVFCAQNGIGEEVRFNEPRQERQTDIWDVIAGQNPMLGLLKNIKGSNGDIASLLPMIMSLMQKPPTNATQSEKSAKSEKSFRNEDENDDAINDVNLEKEDNSTSKKSENTCADMGKEEKHKENVYIPNKEKTQRDIFAPVAFAGYEILCILCSLIKESRHFDI